METKRILYADDDTASRKILERQMRQRGLRCDLAADGPEALRKFRESAYDLVILDRYMPGMDGDEVARAILKLKPSVPLIAVTTDTSGEETLLQAGFRTVLAKPLRGVSHLELIESYLSTGEK